MQTMEQQNDNISFFKGMRDGVPIALGYFAVAFTLGITAGKAGMNALQSSLMSALMLASAGEFAAISMIGSGDDRYYSGHQYALPADVKCFIPEGAAEQAISPQNIYVLCGDG